MLALTREFFGLLELPVDPGLRRLRWRHGARTDG